MKFTRESKWYFKQVTVYFLVCCMFFNTSAVVLADVVPGMIEGQNVTHGSALFDTAGNTTTVTTGGMQTIIEYTRFNVDTGRTVDFVQPAIDAATLNRIIEANPSMINGTVTSNGRLVFLNPAGVYFGQGSSVNSAQLIASALNMSDSDFLAGKMNFAGGDGAVVNKGDISARSVYLVGKQVTNVGNIDCPSGHVVMAAGDRVLIGRAGSNVMVEIGTLEPPVQPDAQQPNLSVDVINEGTINAPEGVIVLAAAGDVLSRAVENVGTLSAAGGSITAKAGEVINSGTMDVSGDTGGKVDIEAAGRLGQFGTVSADGTVGDGGDINLWAGDVVALGSDSLTTANAGTNGDGGEVIVFSPDTALFRDGAKIEAKGGTESGNGGFVEVSGKDHVEFFGDIDLSSKNGITGTLLIDPDNIIIQGGATNSPGGDDDGFPDNADEFSDSGDITITEEVLEDSTANIVLQATNSITVAGTFNQDTNGEGAGAIVRLKDGLDLTMDTRNATGEGSDGIDLTDVDVEFQTQTTGSITIRAGVTGTDAGGDAGSAPVIVGKLTTLGTGSIDLQAEGSVDITDAITTNGGTFTTSGVDFDNTGGDIITNGGVVDLTSHTGVVTIGNSIDTSGGANGDVRIAGSTVDLSQQVKTADAEVQITANSGNIDFADLGGTPHVPNIIAGSGDVILNASLGRIIVANNTDTEIQNSASVIISTQRVGGPGDRYLDLDGAETLRITDMGGVATTAIKVREVASTIESTEIIVGAVDYGRTIIEYSNGDSVTINDDHSLADVDLGQGASSFSYTATTGDISVGTVNVGTETATITASAGSIENDSGLVTADTADLTASGDIGAVGDMLDTSVNTLTADAANIYINEADGLTALNLSAGGGNITLSAGAITDTDGDADISASVADITASAFGDGTDSINTAAADLTVDTSAADGDQYIAQTDAITALDLSAGNGSITLAAGSVADSDGDADIAASAANVTASTFGNVTNSIDTAAADLTVDTSGSDGDQYIDQTDAITALNLSAGNGSITLIAGDVDDSDGGADISASAANVTASEFGSAGNSINTAAADLTVDTSGSDGDQYIAQTDAITALNLSAGNGSITLDAGSIADSDAGTDISASAANVTASAFGNAINSINTAAADLTVDTSAANGDQYIDQTDAITALNLSAGNGSITLIAGDVDDSDGGADISASAADVTASEFGSAGNSINTAAADLTVNTSAANGDQYIAQTGAITALDLDGGGGNITLSADSVTDTDAAADISNTALVALTAPVIGAAANPIALDGATQLEITDTGAGNIFVTELNSSTINSTAITVGAIDYGNMDITYNNTDSVSIADDHFLNNIDLNQGASSFSYTATTGDITVGSVDVGSGQSATITALAGAIDDASSGDSATDITAGTVGLNAAAGIGNSEELELVAGTIAADNSTSGNVVIDNTLASAVTVNTLTTAGGGNIVFDNTGAGGVSYGTVSTSDNGSGVAGENDITLSSNGGNLTVSTSVTAADAGVINYNTNTGNVILNGTSTAAEDLVTINSTGSINGTGLVTAGAANLTAPAGIGNISALDLSGVTNLTLDTNGSFNVSTDVDLRDLTISLNPAGGLETYNLADSGNLTFTVADDLLFDADLNLTQVSVTSGDLNFDLTTDNGNINVGTVGAGAGTVSLTAAAGSLRNTTSSITAGDLTLTADTLNRSIGTAGNELNLTLSGTLTANASNGTGGIFLNETDDMAIVAVDAGSGKVELHSDGSINDATDDTDTDIIGTTATLTAHDEIGGGIATKTTDTAGALETDITSLAAHSTDAGNIVITEKDTTTADRIVLTDVDTKNGAIIVKVESAGGAAGDTVLVNVQADGDGDDDDVEVTADAGSILIGNGTLGEIVSADGSGDVTLEATTGAIDDGTVDTLTDIRADVVELTAADGIGQTREIETEAGTISAETTNNGANIDIDNVNAAANVEIMGLKTSGGTINFDQTGGAVLNIAAAGGGIDSGNGGAVVGGDITINGADGIVVDHAVTSASGSGAALNIGGGVQINANVTAGNGTINLNRSTGFGQGDIIVSSQLNSSGNTGNMNLTTSTGGVQLTTTGRIDAGGEVGLYGNNLIVNPGVAVEIQNGGPGVKMVEAGGNITIQDVSYDHGLYSGVASGEDIIINGPITSTGGGVKIIGGAIYTEGTGGVLNVPITGYSDSSLGVSLNLVWPGSPSGRAAIVMWSLLEDLTLGPAAELTANGVSSGVDERGDIYFTRFGPNAGDPVDVGIYLWCFNLSNLMNPAHVLTVNSDNISSSAGAVVFDAGNSIYFGNNFETYLAGAPDISRIEVVSRIASSLNDVLGAGTPDLPHAGEEMVFWNLIEGPDKGYILRGDFYSSIIGSSFVLDYIDPIPLMSFGLEPPEIEPGEVESVDLDELLAWLENEFGQDAKTYFAGAYNNDYSTDLLPIKSALRLRELSRILGDYEAYIAALTQAVNEFVPDPEMPPSDEQFDAASQVIAMHFNADDGTHYAVAGQWLNAIAEYFSILTNVTGAGNYPEYTEIGWDSDRALLQHILPRYFAGAQENVVGYIGAYILGGS